MIKKLLTVIGLVVGSSICAFAGTNDSTGFYNAKEFSVSVGSGYVVDTANGFQDEYSANLSVGVGYFFTKNIGVTAGLPVYQTEGVAISEAEAGVVGRYPLGRFAPYVGVSVVDEWNAHNKWGYIGKLGLEFRVHPNTALFSEWQYRDNNIIFNDGAHKIVGGIKIVF